jgi:biotin transport system substrate-specific component
MVIMEQAAAVSAKRKTLISITLVALFAALTAAGTFIAIPIPLSPVPIVLQNLFALLSGLILGPFLGAAAVGLYLIAGAIGIPVFAGASGGYRHIIGPTGGFLIGYLLCAFVAGLIAGKPDIEKKRHIIFIAIAAFAGLLAVYVPGVIRLKFALNASWTRAIAAGFIPFIIGDTIKGIIAVIVAPRLRKAAALMLNR